MPNWVLSLPTVLLVSGAVLLGILSARKAVLQWPLIWNEDLIEDAPTRSMVAAYFLYHVLVAAFVALFLVINIVGQFEQASHPAVMVSAGVVLALAFWVGRSFEKAQSSTNSDEPELLYFVRYCQYLLEQRRAKEEAESVQESVPLEFRKPAEISARSILPSIRYIRLKHGDSVLNSLLHELGMPVQYVSYHESPISLKFVDQFLRRLVALEGGDLKAVFRAQSCGGNMECMGAVFFVLARFLSLKTTFEAFVGAANRFDRLCNYRILEKNKQSIVVEVTAKRYKKEAFGSSGEYGLFSVAGWFSAIPNLKGLPSAEVMILRNSFPESGDVGGRFQVNWFESQDEYNASRGPAMQWN